MKDSGANGYSLKSFGIVSALTFFVFVSGFRSSATADSKRDPATLKSANPLSAFDTLFPQTQHKGPNLESETKIPDEACAMLAAAAITGLRDPRLNEWIRDCSKNPNGAVCRDAFKEARDQKMELPASARCSGRF